MDSYDKFNSTIASMYDHTEIYSYKEIKEMEKAERDYEEQCKKDYLEGRRTYTEEDLERIRGYLRNE